MINNEPLPIDYVMIDIKSCENLIVKIMQGFFQNRINWNHDYDLNDEITVINLRNNFPILVYSTMKFSNNK